MEEPRAQDVAASYCATLVDEWARGGVTDAVICPGSRSTPVALALHADDRIRAQVHHDERAGAFIALGLGLATGRPAVLVTTSGTAGAHAHPAVIESHHSAVPLVVVTANRPPELADVGAPQTIDQGRLFGVAPRWFDAPGVPDLVARGTWRARAARSVVEATGAGAAARPGPVHLDLAFREPLVGQAVHVPDGRPDGAPWVVATAPAPVVDPAPLTAVLRTARRGVVIAGAEPGRPAGDDGAVGAAGAHLASVLGWPLLLDARVRGGLSGPAEVAVGAADAILRDPEAAAALRPDVVVHLGAPVASRVVGEWVAASGAVEVRVAPHGWVDPALGTALVIGAPVAAVVAAVVEGGGGALVPATEPGWADCWRSVETTAQQAITDAVAAEAGLTEPATARTVLGALGVGDHLVVSSSMPVRDVEWYGAPRTGVVVHANRGANGIDGVVSTAVGVALGTGARTTCLIGDVAFLHDANALLGVAGRGIDLTIVVVDNDGGGIFSFLPQATEPGGPTFEALFGTPHGVDLRMLAAAHGLDTVEPAGPDDLADAVRAAQTAGGVRLVRVVTDRTANVVAHRRIHTAVAEAVASVLV